MPVNLSWPLNRWHSICHMVWCSHALVILDGLAVFGFSDQMICAIMLLFVYLDNIKLLRIIVVKSSHQQLYTYMQRYAGNRCVVTKPIGN